MTFFKKLSKAEWAAQQKQAMEYDAKEDKHALAQEAPLTTEGLKKIAKNGKHTAAHATQTNKEEKPKDKINLRNT